VKHRHDAVHLVAATLRRSRGRALLLVLVVALAVSVYLLFSSFVGGQRLRSASRAEPLSLPGQAVVMVSRTLGRGEYNSLLDGIGTANSSSPGALARSMVIAYQIRETSLGTRWLLRASADSPIWPHVGQDCPAVPGQGELPPVYVPVEWAGDIGLRNGDDVFIREPDGSLHQMQVAGMFRPPSVFTDALLLPVAQVPRGDGFIVPENADLGRLLARLRTRNLLRYVFTSNSPGELASRMQSQVYLPGSQAMVGLFAFTALGVLTLVLLSFMERKREIGILKTVGYRGITIDAILNTEVLALGLAGVGCGIGLAHLALWVGPRIGWHDLAGLRIGPFSWLRALFAAVSVLWLGSLFPRALARVATVNSLLYDQPIRLFYRKVMD